jgi:benzil reductase ((S)-benzoin forming)
VNKVVYITGTSRGIGKALAELLLSKSIPVIGIGRTSTIVHDLYRHIPADLSHQSVLQQCDEWFTKPADSVVLVNNAGTLGNIAYVGKQTSVNLISTYTLNLIAPAALSNAFLKAYPNAEKNIINISSGAAWNAYDGWSAYCATKAGLAMLGQTIQKEADVTNSKTKVINIAPGIVDTEMQAVIRQADEQQFTMLEKFKELHSTHQLKPTEQVALELLPYVLGEVKSAGIDVRL